MHRLPVDDAGCEDTYGFALLEQSPVTFGGGSEADFARGWHVSAFQAWLPKQTLNLVPFERGDYPKTDPARVFILFAQLEDLLDSLSEDSGDSKRESEGRNVAVCFEGDYRLPRDPNPAGQFLLGHLVLLETQGLDPIDDLGF